MTLQLETRPYFTNRTAHFVQERPELLILINSNVTWTWYVQFQRGILLEPTTFLHMHKLNLPAKHDTAKLDTNDWVKSFLRFRRPVTEGLSYSWLFAWEKLIWSWFTDSAITRSTWTQLSVTLCSCHANWKNLYVDFDKKKYDSFISWLLSTQEMLSTKALQTIKSKTWIIKKEPVYGF